MTADYRSTYEHIASEIGQRIAELLASDPDVFVACADGLALDAETFKNRVRRFGQHDCIAAELATAALARCGWCARPSSRAWVFDPEVFGLDWCEDHLPTGICDYRSLTANAAFAVLQRERVSTALLSVIPFNT